ncbi:MFS transporter [Serratia aquatilis]|uniref:MFS transporter n=1 Tax=Serratia aquatilis TaxID=1737515 RepID=A0ABV6EHG2_9GAMM
MNNQYSIPLLIDQSPVTRFQWRIFTLCFLIALFDGFDTQSIAFTGPAIISAFNLNSGELAPILTAGIVGMVLGAMILGLLGDKYGRRPAILGAVLLFGLASLATAFAQTTDQILLLRFIAGIGMGGATPLILSLSAEYGPANRRGVIMTTVLMGLPIGAICGGLLAAKMLPVIGWQGIFVVGGVVPLALLIVLFFILPESLNYLVQQNKVVNREKVVRILANILVNPHPKGTTYTVPERDIKTRLSSLFSAGLARNTLAIWIIYLFNWVAWFMFLSWLPTVLKAGGLSIAQAPMGTVAVNAVFVLCALPLAMVLPKVNTRLLLLALFIFGILLSLGLAYSGTNWTLMFIFAGAAGLGIGGQQIVLNYMVAEAYPTSLRATATGWAIALGRFGAIIGSASGGWFLEHGGTTGFYLALIAPLSIAALGLLLIRPYTAVPAACMEPAS